MKHSVEIGDIWESTSLIKATYLILEVEGKKIHVLNLEKSEVTFVYDGFFTDDTIFTWRKAG